MINMSTYRALFRSIIHTSQAKVILRDAFKMKQDVYSNEIHLKGAIDWLCLSQDISGSGGCAAAYEFQSGWSQPYPETTGYIISTFLRYAEITQDQKFKYRAIQMGNWEIDIQLPSGAIRGGSGINDYPIVFNTGWLF